MHVVTTLAAMDVGGNISLFKLLPVVVVVLGWAKLLTWIDKDAEAAHLPREMVNLGMLGALVLGVAAFFLMPGFWVGLPVMLLVLGAAAGAYVGLRHRSVGLGDLAKELKGKTKAKKKKAKTVAGAVQVMKKNGTPLPIPESEEDPDSVGYGAVQTMLAEPLKKGAERIEVRPGEGATGVAYMVDGVPYSAASMDRTEAAAGISYMKKAAALEVEDRRKPQTGMMRVGLNGNKLDLEVSTAGSTAGESMKIIVDPKKRYELKLEELGFTADQLEGIKAMVGVPSGIVLLSIPKGQGLTTLEYAILKSHDAYLKHIQSIERGAKLDLEGITQNKMPTSASQADELKQVEWVTSQQPDVVLLDELTNPASTKHLIKFASEGRRVYVGLRAGNTFDALSMWRKACGDDKLAMSQLSLVISGRLLRRLCMACKMAYTPEPDVVRKLGLDPNQVDKLHQARNQPLTDSKGRPIPCDFCHDLAYKGRFGAYEFLWIDDEMRAAVGQGGSSSLLKAAFRKQHGRYLQEVALGCVQNGDTSVQEVLRVMKAPEQSASRSVAQKA